MSGTVTLADDHLALDFPYDPAQVAEIKTIPGAKWDKVARLWRTPASSTADVMDFAHRHGLDVADDVARLTIPRPPTDGVAADTDWVWIRFAYDAVKVRSVKALPSVTWDPGSKAWRVPLAVAPEAVVWADTFRLPVPDEIRAAAETINARRTGAQDASRAQDADIEIPNLAPGLALKPYQRAGVAYAVEHRRTFLADDMGLGKTAMSMSTLEYLDAYPAVVVCPPTLTLNWQVEFNRWFPHRSVAVVSGRKQFPDPADVTVIGWSNISHHADRLLKFTGYVFDESHYAKNPDAQRTKAAVRIAKTAPANGVVLCLTGTPITNRPAEFAPQLDILGLLKQFGGKWGFYRRYAGAFRDRWGQWHIDGATNLEELNVKLRETCFTGDALILTDVGYIRIDELVRDHYNGYVLGWSQDLGWAWGQVVGWRQSSSHAAVDVYLTDGTRFTCTPEHRIHVEDCGWVQAGDLREGDVVCRVRDAGFDTDDASLSGLLASQPESEEAQSLRDLLRRVRVHQAESALLWENLRPQSSPKSKDLPLVQEAVRNASRRTGLLLQTVLQHCGVPPWRQDFLSVGSGAKQSGAQTGRSTSQQTASVRSDLSSSSAVEEDARLAGGANGMARLLRRGVLVRRSRRSDQPARNRGRRIKSSSRRPASDGPTQGVPTFACRVDRVAVHQRPGGSPTEPGHGSNLGLVPVYDIEVAGVHSFLANGVLAHNCYIRRLKSDVLGQLDPVTHNPILVEGDPTVLEEYAKAEADIVVYLMDRARQIAEEIGADPRSAAVRAKIMAESAEHLVRMSVLRKIAAKAKMAAVVELVETHVEAGQKVILAAHHREIVDGLADKFGGLKIQGQMTVAEIEAHKSRFQTLDAGAAPVIVLSIQAAKTGHTLTAAQDVMFVEFPWTWADIEQTYSRAHRLGQQGSVTSTYVLCRGTIDESVYAAVLGKRAVVGAATDGVAPLDDLSVGAAVVGALFDRAMA